MRTKVTWIRQNRKPNSPVASDKTGAPVHLDIFDAMGTEQVCDYPLYDNGMFIVIDTVKDLRFEVIRKLEDGRLVSYCSVSLDKYEAIRQADEYKESELRKEAEDGNYPN